MFLPKCRPLLIGSLPLTSHHQATDMILNHTPDIPLWPQLPKNPGEGMVRQFLSGFPGLIDQGNRFWIDTSRDGFTADMVAFYEEYFAIESNYELLADSRFKLEQDTAAGFYTLMELLKAQKRHPYAIKGQVTGPITAGIGTKTDEGSSIFYDDNLRDMLIKHLTMKGCWQVTEIQRQTGLTTPIIFIDEPAMVSFGSSAFVGITREMVTDSMSATISGIKATGALVGVHICANGDWEPVLQSDADIISFDAYSFFDNLLLFQNDLIDFLNRDGILAWGIVPTGDPEVIAQEDVSSLFSRFEKQLNRLISFGFSEKALLNQVLITPSCGTGSLPIETALKVLGMNTSLSVEIQSKLLIA